MYTDAEFRHLAGAISDASGFGPLVGVHHPCRNLHLWYAGFLMAAPGKGAKDGAEQAKTLDWMTESAKLHPVADDTTYEGVQRDPPRIQPKDKAMAAALGMPCIRSIWENPAVDGARNQFRFPLMAAYWQEGMDEESCMAAMLEWNSRCGPPVQEDELRVAAAARRRHADQRALRAPGRQVRPDGRALLPGQVVLPPVRWHRGD